MFWDHVTNLLYLFTINKVTLRADPSNQVQNGRQITLKCSADISKSYHFRLNYTFSFSKSDKILFNSTSDKEEAQYTILKARYSDSGQYECSLRVEGKVKSSEPVTITVKGIMKPQLKVQKAEVMEGEKVSLRCEIPEEDPPFYFTIFKIPHSSNPLKKNKSREAVSKNFAEFEFPIDAGDKILHFECTVGMASMRGIETSEPSNKILVTVIEPFSIPKITIQPPQNITEGDRIDIKCTTVLAPQSPIEIIIQKDKTILNSTKGKETATYSKIATMEDNGDYTCKAELGSVSKINTVNVAVAELFSKPKMVRDKTHFDENSRFQVQCRVNGPLPIKVSLMKNGKVLVNGSNYSKKAEVADSGNYVCKAEAKGIVKQSDPVLLEVYAPVSRPVLSQPVSQVAVLGKHFVLYCSSLYGTPPITYTLYQGNITIKNEMIGQSNLTAKFEVQATTRHPPQEYWCTAKNGHSVAQRSRALNITVIAPVVNITLTKQPDGDVEDGGDFVLFCEVRSGSFPIEFTFFRENHVTFLYKKKVNENKAHWHKTGLISQDGGKYFCRADNQAKLSLKSNTVTVSIVLASWKKMLIVTIIMLLLLGAAIAIALRWWCRKKAKARGDFVELDRKQATISTSEKLTSGQNNEGEFYYGSDYNEDGEKNHIDSNENNTGPDLENAEVEYTEVEVSVPDPYRAPVTKKNETVYTEIRKAINDAGENRHSAPSSYRAQSDLQIQPMFTSQ
ncbi:platelet endothelial cell adhesion molecule isoform X3 [Pogona vitticeps]